MLEHANLTDAEVIPTRFGLGDLLRDDSDRARLEAPQLGSDDPRAIRDVERSAYPAVEEQIESSHVPIERAFSNTPSVAGLILAEVVVLSRQLLARSRELHDGTWKKLATGCHEVRGKTIGIGGSSEEAQEAIGREVAPFLIKFVNGGSTTGEGRGRRPRDQHQDQNPVRRLTNQAAVGPQTPAGRRGHHLARPLLPGGRWWSWWQTGGEQ